MLNSGFWPFTTGFDFAVVLQEQLVACTMWWQEMGKEMQYTHFTLTLSVRGVASYGGGFCEEFPIAL